MRFNWTRFDKNRQIDIEQVGVILRQMNKLDDREDCNKRRYHELVYFI